MTPPVYIAIIVDNDIKVTIQNNIFYLLDLEEHLLQLQHGDHWLHQREDRHPTTSKKSPPDKNNWVCSSTSIFSRLPTSIVVCPAASPSHLQTGRPTTSPLPSIRPPLRTWFTLPSVNRPLLRKRQLYSRQKLRNKTLKEKIRAKFVYLTNSKSDWHMFQVKKCISFRRHYWML